MNILLVGSGGYGTGYVNCLLKNADPDITWVGIVDPFFESCAKKDEVKAKAIPVYDSLEQFYAQNRADLAVISTPIYLHKAQSIYALEHGSYVLCEKPAAATSDDVLAMEKAAEKTGKWIAIGYQWSFSQAVQELKKDIISGKLGRAIKLKTAISWPRNRAYYRRGSGWGGRIYKNGELVLDSIASNACAHYLHNMFFVLGDSMTESAHVAGFQGRCLRANDIENFDTCSLKMKTDKGVDLYFVASHATDKARDPEFVYEFEKAQVTYDRNGDSLLYASFADGSKKCYGNPFAFDFKKLYDCINAVKNGTVPVCTVKTAYEHASMVERIYNNIPIENFPQEKLTENSETDGIYVQGLYERLYEAYRNTEML